MERVPNKTSSRQIINSKVLWLGLRSGDIYAFKKFYRLNVKEFFQLGVDRTLEGVPEGLSYSAQFDFLLNKDRVTFKFDVSS